MNGPLKVLKDVIQRLESIQVEYFLVGSLASMYYSRPRFTNDIDLVVHIKASQISDFEKKFPLTDYYCPPFEIIRDEIIRMGSFNLIHHESGIKIDIVIQKNSAFYLSELNRRKKVEILPQFEVFIASVEDIILKKLYFYREGNSEKHLLDIKDMLSENSVDKKYLQEWSAELGLTSYLEKLL